MGVAGVGVAGGMLVGKSYASMDVFGFVWNAALLLPPPPAVEQSACETRLVAALSLNGSQLRYALLVSVCCLTTRLGRAGRVYRRRETHPVVLGKAAGTGDPFFSRG